MASTRTQKRSPRARGLRTLQHQTLPAGTRYAIDTEVWYRSLILERDGPPDARWATKDQVHDEAIAWFLKRHRRAAFRDYPARAARDADLTFWIDSRLMEGARLMAERDGVRLARLIEAAFSAYVEAHVPQRLLVFRQAMQHQACELYNKGSRSRRASVPSGAAARARRAG